VCDVSSVRACGVGILHNPVVTDLLPADPGMVDYVSIMPDMFWTDAGPGKPARFVELDGWTRFLDWAQGRYPLVAHSIGLSIGSVEFCDEAYVEQLASWHRRCGFLWHSDHLSFAQVRSAAGHDRHAGMAAPLPFDHDVLDMVVARLLTLRERFPTPFLVENAVSYLRFADEDMTEPEFLNALTRRTGCGLLLDLHNLYTNARNHQFDASDFLRALDLDAVVEIHVAGGAEFAGMYADSHAGPCPEPVWDLLDEVITATPNLKGVTFEFHDSYFPKLGAEGVARELGRAREIWSRRRAA
jgi:uncharacterized protein